MKIVIYTLGCKVNQYERSLQLALEKEGHKVSQNLESADLYILNTCAVTSESERKSRQLVARVNKLNKDAEVVVVTKITLNIFRKIKLVLLQETSFIKKKLATLKPSKRIWTSLM